MLCKHLLHYYKPIWKTIPLELSMYFVQAINTDKIRGTNQELADINLSPTAAEGTDYS